MTPTLTIGPDEAAPGGCPTCSHTLAILATGPRTYRHCDRCGTVVAVDASGHIDIYRPKLVDRVRDFVATGGRGTMASAIVEIVKGIMHRAGIIESIWRPEDRPQ